MFFAIPATLVGSFLSIQTDRTAQLIIYFQLEYSNILFSETDRQANNGKYISGWALDVKTEECINPSEGPQSDPAMAGGSVDPDDMRPTNPYQKPPT